MVPKRVQFNVQLPAESHTEIVKLAVVETEGNASAMCRKLIREALDARSAGSRPVGPAEVVAQTLSAAKVTPAVQPGRIAPVAAPVFSETLKAPCPGCGEPGQDGHACDDEPEPVVRSSRKPAKMTDRERMRALRDAKMGRA